MEKINLQNYQIKKQTKPTSERAELLKEFLIYLNADREKNGYLPLKPARLGMMLQFVKTKELYQFLGDCKLANNFSKYFWYKMKI